MKFPNKFQEYNKSMTYFHTHHQIPRKAPYLSELHEYKEEWTVDLTVEGHACQHDILWKVFRWEGDKAASDGLKGLTSECHQRTSSLGGKNGAKSRKEKGHYGLGHCHVQPVIAINKKTLEETWFPSQKAASDALNVIPNHISEIVRNIGTRKSSKGFYFRRAT